MKKQPAIIDISLPIYSGMITYPKNPDVSFETLATGTSFLTRITMGSHTGTHVDVPGHVFSGKKGVADIPLSTYMGPCRVLDMRHVKECMRVSDLEKARIKKGERLLVRTRNSTRGFKEFYPDYVYLDGDAADYLASRGIVLFGIDALSVKKRGGEDQRPHTSLLGQGIVIIEGLNLAKATPGMYTLVSLPLHMRLSDGAPMRAVLLPKGALRLR